MYLDCTNQGCRKSGEHVYSKKDNTVYCVECGGAVNLPETTKRMLDNIGQVKKHKDNVGDGITRGCAKCSNIDRPLLKKLNAVEPVASADIVEPVVSKKGKKKGVEDAVVAEVVGKHERARYTAVCRKCGEDLKMHQSFLIAMVESKEKYS